MITVDELKTEVDSSNSSSQCFKGFFRFRWMLDYVAAIGSVDRCTEGSCGNQLRMAHTQHDFTAEPLSIAMATPGVVLGRIS